MTGVKSRCEREQPQDGAVGEEEELVQVEEGGLRTGVNTRCELAGLKSGYEEQV